MKIDWNKKIEKAHAVMDEAIKQHKPTHVFGLFSGGHDSLTATSIAARHPAFTAAVHINTGIGIEETREFVRETCRRERWRLLEYHAERDCGQSYEKLVLERGFPGPPMHYKMYSRLKERALRLLVREHKRKFRDRIMLVTGCRSQESTRRMGHVERIQRDGVKLWVSPVHDWTKTECNEYIEWANLQPNEVVQLIHMSGECLCGAFAHPGELDEIALWFPRTAERIRRLEEKVKAVGFDWGWEGRKKPRKSAGKPKRDASGRIKKEVLCQSCNARNS